MEYLFAICCVVLHCFYGVIGNSTTSSISKDSYMQDTKYNNSITLMKIENDFERSGANFAKTRFKRQQSSGAGKFTQAAKMPQIKALRLFLTMFKNLWAPAFVGGAHPFHPHVPKPIVQLYKQKVVEFFFPDVGDDARKEK